MTSESQNNARLLPSIEADGSVNEGNEVGNSSRDHLLHHSDQLVLEPKVKEQHIASSIEETKPADAEEILSCPTKTAAEAESEKEQGKIEELKNKREKMWGESLDESLRELIEAQVSISNLYKPASLWTIEGYQQPFARLLDLFDAYHLASDKDKKLISDMPKDVVLLDVTTFNGSPVFNSRVFELLNSGKSVVLMTPQKWVSPAISRHISAKITFSDLQPLALRFVQKMKNKGCGKPTESGEPVEDYLGRLSVIPVERQVAVYSWLFKMFDWNDPDYPPISQALLDGFSLFAQPALRLVNTPVFQGKEPQTLDALVGIHPQTRQKLIRLRSKMKQGKPLTQGIMLFGEPGTGKTLIAKILAQESGRTFVQASQGDWMAAGQLNDHLQAMRNSFQEAIQAAPSVMFIDEFDSAGSRGRNGNGEAYMTCVINSLLEWIQNAISQNVALFAATNFPQKLDPALIRPGRIGEKIEISHPTEQGRLELVRHFFSGCSIDMESVNGRVGACSPAQLKAFSEEVYELAEENGKPLPDEQELNQAFTQESFRLLNGRDPVKIQKPLAISLCAKARMALLIWKDEIILQGISLLPGLIDLGRLEMTHPRGLSFGTAAETISQLHFELASAAGRRAAALAQAAQGKEQTAMGCLAFLNPAEQAAASQLVLELVKMGRPKMTDASLSQNISTDTLTQNILDEHWHVVVRSTLQGIVGIESAATVLVQKKWMHGDKVRDLLFDLEKPKHH